MTRFQKFDQILSILQRLEGAHVGLSLTDIEEELEVGKRTAQRILEALRRNFDELEGITYEDGTKRWRLPRKTRRVDLQLGKDELTALSAARNLLYKDGRLDDVETIDRLNDKLCGLLPEGDMRRLEPDLEALMEAEGLATRPGPRPRYDAGVLDALREAILACKVVKVNYRKRGAKTAKSYRLHPYGFIYGHRHYLVAVNEAAAGEKRTFVLELIESVEILDEYFARDDDFSLAEFSRRSFGVFQEEPQEIIWKFSDHAAETAESFYFHPDQELQKHKDGTLTVKFKAGGMLEMAWHLVKWGHHVEVIRPQFLAELVQDIQKDWGLCLNKINEV